MFFRLIRLLWATSQLFFLTKLKLYNKTTTNIITFSSIKEPDEYDYSEDIYYKAIGDLYTELPNEAIIINTLAAAMVALAILLPCIIKCDTFHKGLEPEAEVESDVE